MSYFKSGVTYEFLTSIPELHSPGVICGFPGTGYVGKMAVDHLIHELKAIHLVDLYCTSFPPRVIISPEGIVDLTKNSLHYSKQNDQHKRDFIFVTGDAQPINPELEYLLAEEILKIVKKFQSPQIFTLGAYTTGAFTREPNVYCAATDMQVLESLTVKNVIKLGDGSISGMNGLILGIAKLFNMQGLSLLGETSGYVIDAIASKSVLHSLMQITGLNVGMQDMENRAKDTEMLIRTIEQQVTNKVAPPGSIVGQVPPKRQPDTAYIS